MSWLLLSALASLLANGSPAEVVTLRLQVARADGRAAGGAGQGALSDCPTEAALIALLQQQVSFANVLSEDLADEPGREPSPELRVRMMATSRGSRGFRAEIELRDAHGALLGQRRLESRRDTCQQLLTTAAFVIATELETLRPAPAAAAAPLPPTVPPAVPLPIPTAPEPVAALPLVVPLEPRAAPPARSELESGLGVAGVLGASVEPGLGVTGDFGWHWTWFSLGVGGRFDLQTSKVFAAAGPVQTQLTVGQLVPCVRPPHWGFCGLLLAGLQAASALGLSNPQPVSAGYAAIGARTFYDLPLLPQLSLRLQLDAVVPVVTAALLVDNLGVAPVAVWRTPPVAAIIAIALTSHLPL